MRLYLFSMLTLLLTACYSNPDSDYLDTIPKTNNSALLPLGGEQGTPQMPLMPGGGPMGAE